MPSFEWRATIQGRPASKKNSRRIFHNRSLPSAAYKRFHADALEQLRGKTPPEPYAGLVSLELHVYIKGRYRQDWDNAGASISDLVQDAGVIVDDDQIVAAHVYKHPGTPEWRSEVSLRALLP